MAEIQTSGQQAPETVVKKEASNSSGIDESQDLSRSFNEDAPEEPKYVPIHGGGKGGNAMILTKKMTLRQD